MNSSSPDSWQALIDKYEEPQLHRQTLMEASVITLDIPPRLLFPLGDAGIRTTADLLLAFRSGLWRLPRVGVKGAELVEAVLRRTDLIDMEPER